MSAMRMSLDSLRGKPVYLGQTRPDFGFIDDVIIAPCFGILAVVAHGSRSGTWAFPYTHTQIASDAITVDGHARQSPRVFLREGRSYQDMIDKKVKGSDGATVGRIKDIALVDLVTGEIAYRVRAGGLRRLWTPEFVVPAPTGVLTAGTQGIVLRTEHPTTKNEERCNSNRDQAA